MNSRKLVRMLAGSLIIIGAAAFVGCEERNEADLPPIVYSLKHNIVTPGVALYVDLKQTILGIAASSAGTYVYDISNVTAPVETFHYAQTGGLYSNFVGIDAPNGLVVTSSEPSLAPGDKYPIHRLSDSLRIGAATFSSGIEEISIVSRPNQFEAWRSDRSDGIVHSLYCYNPDSGRWRPDYCSAFYFPFSLANVVARGFGVSDSSFAIALNNYEIRIHNVFTGVTEAIVQMPGDPQDCAWYGDYVLVADNLFLTVVDLADFGSPIVVKTLTIPGADRLQRIVVDGTYAVLLDDADGVYVVDVSTPTDPKHVQSISLPEPTSISSFNGTLAVSDEQLGVLIYQR